MNRYSDFGVYVISITPSGSKNSRFTAVGPKSHAKKGFWTTLSLRVRFWGVYDKFTRWILLNSKP